MEGDTPKPVDDGKKRERRRRNKNEEPRENQPDEQPTKYRVKQAKEEGDE